MVAGVSKLVKGHRTALGAEANDDLCVSGPLTQHGHQYVTAIKEKHAHNGLILSHWAGLTLTPEEIKKKKNFDLNFRTTSLIFSDLAR